MGDHDYDNLPPHLKDGLKQVDWVSIETTIRMGCGCPCTLQPGDILWVLSRHGRDLAVAVTRRGTAH